MASLVDRMVRAAKLDPSLYDEVERDETALGQAMTVVLVSSVAAGIGSVLFGGPIGLVLGTLVTLAGWFVWAVLVHFIGTNLISEPGVRVGLTQVLRVIGFSAAPGVVRVLAFLPLLGRLINLAVSIWMLVAMIVAVRQVFKYQNPGKAVLVCIIGWVIQLFFIGALAALGLGGLFLLAAG